jgi:hypothetical protein
MRDFNELKNLIDDKFKIGDSVVTEGNWDSQKETFEKSGEKNCYWVQVEKNFKEGNLIKTISQFSEIDNRKSQFKKELIDVLKIFKNKGCEIHISQTSTTYKIKFDIYIIRTEDLDQWYVPLDRSEWYDENGSLGYLSQRYYINNREMTMLKSKGWTIRKGEEVFRDIGGNKDSAYYNRRWIERINAGFYFVTLDQSELKPDKWGYVNDPKIAFVKKPDDYFLCFFNITFVSGVESSFPDCLVVPRMGNSYVRSGSIFKCDQIDGLIKCIEDYQL